jgi:hypothetical protein
MLDFKLHYPVFRQEDNVMWPRNVLVSGTRKLIKLSKAVLPLQAYKPKGEHIGSERRWPLKINASKYKTRD